MMSLTEAIKAATAAGFEAGGDLKVSATFTQVTGTNYDPETGNPTETAVNYAGIEGFRRSYTLREMEAGIAQAGDIRFVVQADDIGFDLSVIDRVTIAGAVYQIKEFSPDPAGATYVIRLRA
jgi:peptidoglycan/xylan/chitin deacetylase (PgdA/CDA1 family)